MDDVLGNKLVDIEWPRSHADRLTVSFTDRPEVIAEQDLISLHQALMSYVQTEFVEGSAELGMSCKKERRWLKGSLQQTYLKYSSC